MFVVQLSLAQATNPERVFVLYVQIAVHGHMGVGTENRRLTSCLGARTTGRTTAPPRTRIILVSQGPDVLIDQRAANIAYDSTTLTKAFSLLTFCGVSHRQLSFPPGAP